MKIFLAIISMILFISCDNKHMVSTLQVPGINRYCEINIKGESVIPSGRLVKPFGEFVRIPPDPFGLALSPDGTLALSLHNNLLTLINLSLIHI